MRLLHPILLLAAVPPGLLLLWLHRTRGVSITGGRRWAAALRIASLALLVLALAQPQVGNGPSSSVVLALDRSFSIAPGASATQRAWLVAEHKSCRPGCRAVQFAGAAQITATGAGLLPSQEGGALAGGETNLQAGLSLAIARSSSGGQVVLMSDGLATTGEADAAIAQARARHVRVDVVPLPDSRVDAAVTRVQAPKALHAGDPLSLEVSIRSTVARGAKITLTRNGVLVASETVHLKVGENPYLPEGLRAPGPGVYSYGVSVSMPGDEVPQNDALSTIVRVSNQPSVLIAGRDAQPISTILSQDGMRVSTISPTSLPSTAGGYASQDAVVLDDVSATELGDQRAQAVTEAVREGRVGLLALGGQHSFSLGRYYHSPLQQALPVSSLIPGNLQRRNLAIELVLDRSGSMVELAGGVSKISMAKQAAKVAARLLSKHDDELGIVSFEIEPHIFLPVTRVTPGKGLATVEHRIDKLFAEGGTNIYKGLEAGADQVEASPEPERHIILMTDGISEPGTYAPLLPQLHMDHISVSTVALGHEADFTLLKAIALATSGQYYATDNAHELPKIFAKQTSVNARPVRLHGKIGVSPGSSSPIVRSLAGQPLPTLHGNVVTTIKPGAQVDLLGEDTGHEPDPVLAQWQYGVGRVVTWTPGLGAEWASAWAQRPRLWQDAMRWLQRGVAIPALTPKLVEGSDSEIEVDTVDNADTTLDLANLNGTLTAPDGKTEGLSFEQTAPSHYVASLAHPLAQGSYRYSISADRSTSNGLLDVPYPAELRLAPESSTPLGPIAQATGGRVLQTNEQSVIELHWSALWWWLALAALACFLGAVALRMLGGSPRGPRESSVSIDVLVHQRDTPSEMVKG